jgi:hypothetical protein
MKICSSIVPKDPWGGSFQFAKHLLEYLSRQGVEITFNLYSNYDILYFNSWLSPYSVVQSIKNRGVRILHRIDEIGKIYGRPGSEQDALQLALNEFANFKVMS